MTADKSDFDSSIEFIANLRLKKSVEGSSGGNHSALKIEDDDDPLPCPVEDTTCKYKLASQFQESVVEDKLDLIQVVKPPTPRKQYVDRRKVREATNSQQGKEYESDSSFED